MSGENRVKLSERIYERAKALWPRYLTHPFVMEMADGTLPKEKFRYYMVQDYLYLRDYVKIFAAILQKTDDFEQIRFLSGEMANTIDETFRTHLPYMKRLGVTEEEIADARPHIDNSAYSHYMLCEAQAGDVLTGLVTLLNCSWSYAYIAEQMVERCPSALHDENYGAWFAGYVSEEYRSPKGSTKRRRSGSARSSKIAAFLTCASGTWSTRWARTEQERKAGAA